MRTVAVPKTKCNKSGGKESSLFKVVPEGEESRREQVSGDRCDDVKGVSAGTEAFPVMPPQMVGAFMAHNHEIIVLMHN